MSVIDVQLLIMFYKDEVRKNPDFIANKSLLAKSIKKLKGFIDG